MSYQNEQAQLQGRLNDNIVSLGNPPVAWANLTFPPAGGQPDPAVLWLRFNILNSEVWQITIGAATNYHHHLGIVTIQVHAPLNAGNGDAMTKADLIAALFRNWKGTNIRCKEATVKEIGEVEGFHQINITIPFYRDELF